MVCCVDRALCQVALRVLSGGLAAVGLALVGLAAWAAVLGGEVAGLGELATVRAAARYPLWVALVGAVVFLFGLVSALCVGRKVAKGFYCVFVPAMAAAALALATLLVGLRLAASSLSEAPGGGGEPHLVFFGHDLTPQLERQWEDLVQTNPQKACSFETSFRCAGFRSGDCAGAVPGSGGAPDAEALEALYARCPGRSEAADRVAAFGGRAQGGGGLDPFESDWDVRRCLRAEALYASDGCFRLAADLVQEWGTILFIPGLCAAGYILLMALVAMYLTCCTCCWM